MREFLIDNITYLALDQRQLNEAKMIAEGSGLSGLLIKDILLQEVDKKNANGRVYKRPILEREVKKYVENLVNQKASYGELDHPETSTIRLKEVCHIIPRLYWSGDRLMGDLNILPTPNGRIVESILRAGGRVGVSSRALGSVERKTNEIGEGFDEVGDDLELICWDCVSSPSVLKAAFYLTEGLEKNAEVLNRFKKINHYIDNILKA